MQVTSKQGGKEETTVIQPIDRGSTPSRHAVRRREGRRWVRRRNGTGSNQEGKIVGERRGGRGGGRIAFIVRTRKIGRKGGGRKRSSITGKGSEQKGEKGE